MRVYAISETAFAVDMTVFNRGLKSGLKSQNGLRPFEAV